MYNTHECFNFFQATQPQQESRTSNASPPLDSSGSSVNSESTHSGQEDKQSEDEDEDTVEEDSESFDLVTCFCGKPFAGRAMIECSMCLTWIHLSCARIKKNNIPEVSINAFIISYKSVAKISFM